MSPFEEKNISQILSLDSHNPCVSVWTVDTASLLVAVVLVILIVDHIPRPKDIETLSMLHTRRLMSREQNKD